MGLDGQSRPLSSRVMYTCVTTLVRISEKTSLTVAKHVDGLAFAARGLEARTIMSDMAAHSVKVMLSKELRPHLLRCVIQACSRAFAGPWILLPSTSLGATALPTGYIILHSLTPLSFCLSIPVPLYHRLAHCWVPTTSPFELPLTNGQDEDHVFQPSRHCPCLGSDCVCSAFFRYALNYSLCRHLN
jgi:hypothetical protein